MNLHCQHDTDGDGNCHVHPNGCPVPKIQIHPLRNESTQEIEIRASVLLTTRFNITIESKLTDAQIQQYARRLLWLEVYGELMNYLPELLAHVRRNAPPHDFFYINNKCDEITKKFLTPPPLPFESHDSIHK